MLTPEQIDDFVELTQPLFKRHKWTDISLGLVGYVSADIINEKKVMEAGGPTINFKVKHRNTGNARNTGLFAQDVTSVEDVAIGGSVPWSFQTTNYSYDIYEDLFQSDRETIIRELQLREHDALSDMAELQEENLWSAPATTSDTRPMGIPFWIKKDATTTVGGAFNGGNPTNFTSGAAGISSTTYPRWKNWTFGYTNPTVDDLIAKVKKSMYNTRFVPPVPHPELGFGGADYHIYTTYRVVEPLERLAETRNDNLGADLARYRGAVMIGGVPVTAVPYLEENDTSDPLYGINWKVLRPYCKKGATMVRGKPKEAARQHTVREVHIDNAWNMICVNRRALWVGSKS